MGWALAFRLSRKEFDSMRSQIVTTSQRYRRSDSLPVAFTEQGVAMLSSVLRSSRAVEVNIAIMRTFVQLRRSMATRTAIWPARLMRSNGSTTSNFRLSSPQSRNSSLRLRHSEERSDFIRENCRTAPSSQLLTSSPPSAFRIPQFFVPSRLSTLNNQPSTSAIPASHRKSFG
jgi:ORF6N domain